MSASTLGCCGRGVGGVAVAPGPRLGHRRGWGHADRALHRRVGLATSSRADISTSGARRTTSPRGPCCSPPHDQARRRHRCDARRVLPGGCERREPRRLRRHASLPARSAGADRSGRLSARRGPAADPRIVAGAIDQARRKAGATRARQRPRRPDDRRRGGDVGVDAGPGDDAHRPPRT